MGSSPPDQVSQLLFGSIRKEVLSLLLSQPDKRFYLREIVRAAGGGSGAVQRELRQLVAAGLVEREVRGHHVYFSANQDAPIFGELRAIIEKTAGAAGVLRTRLAPLQRRGRIELGFVYGSVASGRQTTRSDVDLLLVGKASVTELLQTLRSVGDQLGREINPTLYSVKEFRDKVLQGTPYLKRILAGPKLLVAGDERDLARLAR